MKIGIDCRLWSQTGVGRYIRNLVLNLQIIDKVNSYVLFVRTEDLTSVNSGIQNSKFKIQNCDIRWHSVTEQVLFPRILYKENLDLVHFPYFSVPIFYNKPFVVTIHDLIINKLATGRASTHSKPFYLAKRLGYNMVFLRAIRTAKKIIVPTHAVKDQLVIEMRVPAEKVEVTYEGTSFEKPKTKNQKPKLQFKTQKYLLYVGNAYPHKNLDRLVDTISLLQEKRKDIQLVLVGKEDYFYKRLKEKVKGEHLEDHVLFADLISDEELVRLYKNAKALIFPSFMEGFGLPAVEAMSLSCPVIASDIPALREVCQDAAIYFNPYSAAELANVIQNVYGMKSAARKRLTEKGEKRAKDFSWELMSKQTLAIYESCISV